MCWCLHVSNYLRLSASIGDFFVLSLFVKYIGAFDFVCIIRHFELMLAALPACIVDPRPSDYVVFMVIEEGVGATL
jgi:hypothetical protein